jgi:hypothetical protein
MDGVRKSYTRLGAGIVSTAAIDPKPSFAAPLRRLRFAAKSDIRSVAVLGM